MLCSLKPFQAAIFFVASLFINSSQVFAYAEPLWRMHLANGRKCVTWIRFQETQEQEKIFLQPESLLLIRNQIFALTDLGGDYTYQVEEIQTQDQLATWAAARPRYAVATKFWWLDAEEVIEDLPRLIEAAQNKTIYNQINFSSKLTEGKDQYFEIRNPSEAEKKAARRNTIKETVFVSLGGAIFQVATAAGVLAFYPMSHLPRGVLFGTLLVFWQGLDQSKFLGRRLKFHERMIAIPVSAAASVATLNAVNSCIGIAKNIVTNL